MSKTKTIPIAIIALLALSLVLAAIPMAGAGPGLTIQIAPELIGAAAWAENPDTTRPEGIALGRHSVLLSDGTGKVEIIPPSGIKFSDLADLVAADDWSFWHYHEDSVPENEGVGLELRFTADWCTDPDGAGHVDITVNTAEFIPGLEDTWTEEKVTKDSTATCYGNDPDGVAFTDDVPEKPGVSTGIKSLSELVDFVTTLAEEEGWVDSDPADWELTRVRVELYTANPFHIDDITIDGVTFFLEHILLDEEYYHTGSPVTVSVVDSSLNTDPLRAEEKEALVTAESIGDSITVDGKETGVNTGIFVGTFGLVAENPAEDELVVTSEDTITVTHAKLIDTAGVDDLAPSVTIISPERNANISIATPIVEAEVEDVGPSRIEIAWMTLDNIVRASTAEDPGTLKYEVPEVDALLEGTHNVVVNARDKAGNLNVTSWSFTVDTTEPTCVISMNVTSPVSAIPIEFTFEFNEDMDEESTVLIAGNATDYLESTDPVEADWIDLRTYSANYTVKPADFNGTVLLTAADALDVAGNVMIPANMTFYIDTLDPTAPENLTATQLLNSIVLSWDASEDLGSGVELYKIHRGVESENWNVTVGSVLHPVTEFVDTDLEAGTYYYVVEAFDFAGNSENSTEATIEFEPVPVTSYEISLVEGWNLVSLPLIPDNSSITAVLADIVTDVEVVWGYDASTTPGTWLRYLPAVPEISDLTEMVDGAGYWVKMTADATLVVYGTELPEPPATPPVYHVYAGWNLIGFKEARSMLVKDYLTTIPTELKESMVIYGWDAVDQRYRLVCVGTPGGQTFDPGQGYWLYMIDEADIAPP